MNHTIIDKNTNFRLRENFLENEGEADSLHYTASQFGVDADNYNSAEEIADAVVSKILQNPKRLLFRLMDFEMEIVKAIIKAGCGKAVQFRQSDTVIPMCLLHVANIYTDVTNEKTIVWMADELRETLAPYVDEVAESEEYQQQKDFEHYVMGCLNLYGVMIKDELLELVLDFYEDDEADLRMKHYHDGFISEICSIDIEHNGKRTKLYNPPYINLTDNLLHYYHSRLERDASSDFKPYDFEQIITVGRIAEIRIPNAHHERLVKCLMRTCSMSRARAVDTVFMIWRESQTEMDSRDIIDYVLDMCDRFESRKELQKNLVKYMNYMPMWVLKGYTSMDILAMNPSKVGVTSQFGDNVSDDDGLPELFGDVEITPLGDIEQFPFGFGPMGEA